MLDCFVFTSVVCEFFLNFSLFGLLVRLASHGFIEWGSVVYIPVWFSLYKQQSLDPVVGFIDLPKAFDHICLSLTDLLYQLVVWHVASTKFPYANSLYVL